MRRVISVWFPTFSTDRLAQPEQSKSCTERSHFDAVNALKSTDNKTQAWRHDHPVIIATNRMLTAVNAAAAELGLRPGMKLAQAQALVPGLEIKDGDADGDAAALARLAEWCLRYAPLAATDPPDGLWIDVSGSTHLYDGEAELLRDLVRRLNDYGLTTTAAVADIPAVANAVARFGNGGVVPAGTAVVADFPIEALRLPANTLADLRLMGFERIGPLITAARAPLVRRFGTMLALRLDQVSGKVFEPITPIIPSTLIQAKLAFVEPLLTAEAFSYVIAELIGTICNSLEQAGLGARQLDLLFERLDRSIQAIRIRTAVPSRNARHLGRMLDERLEQIDPGLGVEAMRLVVPYSDRLDYLQTRSSMLGEASPNIAPLVDRLANRLGEARVYRIVAVESDVPERSVRRLPAMYRVDSGWPADLPRPIRMLDPPQPIDAIALLPDHPPIAFTWRRVRHRVRHADGPERIAGEWWKRDREWFSVRDYFRVEDDGGRRFWLFRRGNGSDTDTGDMRWFLHGIF